jgi:hypothetical protein
MAVDPRILPEAVIVVHLDISILNRRSTRLLFFYFFFFKFQEEGSFVAVRPSKYYQMSPIASSDDPATAMTPQPERPEQGKFSKDETNFLKTYLPAYESLCHQLAEKATGPKGTGLVKGDKKDWVLSKVFPEFVKQFSSDQNGGPQLQSLQKVSYLLQRVPVTELY